MALVCNIDQRGRTVRYRVGFTLLALGVLSCAAAWASASALGFVLGGPLVAGGLFALFEANRGWCAVRAMGFKTRV